MDIYKFLKVIIPIAVSWYIIDIVFLSVTNVHLHSAIRKVVFNFPLVQTITLKVAIVFLFIFFLLGLLLISVWVKLPYQSIFVSTKPYVYLGHCSEYDMLVYVANDPQRKPIKVSRRITDSINYSFKDLYKIVMLKTDGVDTINENEFRVKIMIGKLFLTAIMYLFVVGFLVTIALAYNGVTGDTSWNVKDGFNTLIFSFFRISVIKPILMLICASFLITMISQKLQKPVKVEDSSEKLFEEFLGNIKPGDKISGLVENSTDISVRKAKSNLYTKVADIFYIKFKNKLNENIYIAIESSYPSSENEILNKKLENGLKSEFEVTKDYTIKFVPQK